MIDLYHPPDVNLCHKEWGATCGPCSLAAAIERPVADVFEAVSDPPSPDELPGISPRRFRGFMTITHMRAALDRLGTRVVRFLTEEWRRKPGAAPESRLEDWLHDATAIACLQWGGPWDDVPRAAARYRHFITIRFVEADDDGPQLWVYDWNATSSISNDGAWAPWAWWESKVLSGLLPESGNGTYRIQWAGAITKRR